MTGFVKELNSLIKLVFFSLPLLTSTKASAQVCDESIRKGLEQTRISYFSKVTQGATASFAISYPLEGTRYVLTDDQGNSYPYLYTGIPKQATLIIEVGQVGGERKFTLSAQNGNCSYTSPFEFKITPVLTPQLALRTEQEWCNRSGAIYFHLVGEGISDADYEFFVKKSSDVSYDFSVTGQVDPAIGKRTLEAGYYDLIARLKTDHSKTIEQKNIQIKRELENINFTLQYIPNSCTGAGSIQVNVRTGKYPLYFTLRKQDGTTIVSRQTSNIFTSVPAGQYQVIVEDYCADGGGNAIPKPITVVDYAFTLDRFVKVVGEEAVACDRVQFGSFHLTTEALNYFWASKNIPFPLTVRAKFTSPSQKIYTAQRTVNSWREFAQYFQSGGNIWVWQESLQFPKEFGTWNIALQATYCGTTKDLGVLTRDIRNTLSYYNLNSTY